MSPFATALKVGTTHLVLTLLEEGRLPSNVLLQDAVFATRSVSREGRADAPVILYDGRAETALGIQEKFHAAAVEALAGRDEETDWVLEQWAFVLEGLRGNDLEMLIGAVDWASKKWLLETFRAENTSTFTTISKRTLSPPRRCPSARRVSRAPDATPPS